jgi:hypothetical protein
MNIRKFFILYSTLVLIVLTFPLQVLNAHPLNNWHWRSPIPQGNDLSNVAYGNGIFVAVGDTGTIITSEDAANWSIVNNLDPLINLTGIAYGKDIFVATGNLPNRKGVICTSTDGISWNVLDFVVRFYLIGVDYCNGIFIITGNSNRTLTSSDGTKWTFRTTGKTEWLSGVAYGNGTFVVVGYYQNYWNDLNSFATIFTSTDGVRWTSRTSGSVWPLYGVAYGNNTFVAVGHSGTILTSPDGITWTQRDLGYLTNYHEITYMNGIFLMPLTGGIAISSDGMTWTGSYLGINYDDQLSGVTYGNDRFVTVGQHGAIYDTADTLTWTNRKLSQVQSLKGIVFGGGILIAWEPRNILSSSDGRVWTERFTAPNDINDVAHGNGTFVAVGQFGSILTSSDGVVWAQNDSLRNLGYTYRHVIGAAYGNGLFVAILGDETIFTSTDGETWTVKTIPIDRAISKIFYMDGSFFAWGADIPSESSIILTSPDGDTWTEVISTNIVIEDLVYGNGILTAVDRFGDIYTSPDGVSWTKRFAATGIWLNGIAYGEGIIVAVGYNNITETGLILTSTDGINWINRDLKITFGLSGVAYGNKTFFSWVKDGSPDLNDVLFQSDHIAGPAISVTLASINFGEVAVGDISEKPLIIQNIGTENLIIGILPDLAIPFSKINDNCSGQTLIPGENCMVTVMFAPISLGSFISYSIIPSNDPDRNSVTITLNGIGSGVIPQLPSSGSIFGSCSLITGYQPSFIWTPYGSFTGYSIVFSASQTDFTTPIVKANISSGANSWTPSIWPWKKIMTSSHNAGAPRDIYWKVIGNKSDGTKVQSETRSFRIGDRQEVTIHNPQNPAVLPAGTPPTFDFDTHCNTKFRLEFSSLDDFSDPRKIKAFTYVTRDPNIQTTIQKTLTLFQWNTVKKLVGTETGYFRIKAWDGINRGTTSEVRFFMIQ